METPEFYFKILYLPLKIIDAQYHFIQRET
ncbi:MAG: hypothetical protein RLZZ44_1919 [Bacteroidota bacterium]|jgi:hypothetical protein